MTDVDRHLARRYLVALGLGQHVGDLAPPPALTGTFAPLVACAMRALDVRSHAAGGMGVFVLGPLGPRDRVVRPRLASAPRLTKIPVPAND